METQAIGTNIKKIRELKNFTQEYMAEKLGITQPTYARVEKEDADLTITRLTQISTILEVSLDELIHFNPKGVFNNYGSYKGTQTGDYIEGDYSKEYIELLKEKIQRLEAELDALKKE
jgi:transcriptional regulator with XRE-family HTH domain